MIAMKAEVDLIGQVVGGDVGNILIREKSGRKIELGDLLAVDEDDGSYLILQVYDLGYGSQISESARQLAAGLKLEGYGGGMDFYDANLRNYTLAMVRAVASVSDGKARMPKVLPSFFSSVRYATEEDLAFIAKPPKNPVFLGKIRSGSKIRNVNVYLGGEEFFTHHVLIPATTGRGKSNLVKVMLWSALEHAKFGILVLDPHDEYYGRNGKGLKDHLNARKNLAYYSSTPPAGCPTLIINLRSLEPEHFDGIVEFSDAQEDAISIYHSEFKEEWIEKIVLGEELERVNRRTLKVLQRKFKTSLGVSEKDGDVICDSEVFRASGGESTVNDIVSALEKGRVVVVETSRLGDEAELLIGSIIANEAFYRYRESKGKGRLDEKPPISIVVEEAPRVLSAERIEQGGNIYSTISREGRKFKVGLIAITQLTSVIPRPILTNMNTKIILGNEMAPERRAIIESAAQDLAHEERTIASLDKGEAIVSSIFTKFAVPIYTPLFEEIVGEQSDEFDFRRDNLILK
jgi:DNA helicase HerA-like ATPase